MDAVLGLVMLGGCGVLVVLVFQARQGRFGANVLMVLAASCATALGIMLATDWPMEVLSGFWAGHSVLAAVLTTLLIVGIGFFAFEVREAQESDRLDRSVTAAGFGGLVDHVVDVEVTLALATRPDPPDKAWPDWRVRQRPLRWLQRDRELLLGATHDGASPVDPRADAADSYLAVGLDQWRVELMDQAVRRLLAGIRDWAPVVDRSRNGVELLITLSFLRNTLVSLPARWDSVSAEVSALRHLCRVLAMHLELHSGTDVRPHPEVLPWVDGSARPIGELDGLDTLVTRAWMRQLQHTEKEMARR